MKTLHLANRIILFIALALAFLPIQANAEEGSPRYSSENININDYALSLPFRNSTGTNFYFQGPHPMNGISGERSAIDLIKTDRGSFAIYPAAPGIAYVKRICPIKKDGTVHYLAELYVRHADIYLGDNKTGGLATGYLHVRIDPKVFGINTTKYPAVVVQGKAKSYDNPTTSRVEVVRTFKLGDSVHPGNYISNGCGVGSTNHLHFSVQRWSALGNGLFGFTPLPIDNVKVGGWKIEKEIYYANGEKITGDYYTGTMVLLSRNLAIVDKGDPNNLGYMTLSGDAYYVHNYGLAGDGVKPPLPVVKTPRVGDTVILTKDGTTFSFGVGRIDNAYYNPVKYEMKVTYTTETGIVTKNLAFQQESRELTNPVSISTEIDNNTFDPIGQIVQWEVRVSNINGTSNWVTGSSILVVAEQNSTYKITSKASFPDLSTQKVLDVTGKSLTNGTGIQVWDWSGYENNNQIWYMVPTGRPSEFWLVSAFSRKCLDVRDWNNHNGARLQQYDCHFGDNQRFIVEEHDPLFSSPYLTIKSALEEPVEEGGNDLYVDVNVLSGNGDYVQLWEPGALDSLNANKKWTFQQVPLAISCTSSGIDAILPGSACFAPTVTATRTSTVTPTSTIVPTRTVTVTSTSTLTATAVQVPSETPTGTSTQVAPPTEVVSPESPSVTPDMPTTGTPTDATALETPQVITETATWTPEPLITDTFTPTPSLTFTPTFTGTPSPTLTPTRQSITFSKSVTVNASQDAYAQSNYPTSAAGNTRNVYLGYDTVYSKYKNRIYVRFNLPTLPSGYQITSAQVEIYQYVTECSSSYSVTAYDILSNWSESTLTWNAQPGKGASKGSASIGCSLGWKSIPITPIVQEWYQGYRNYGVTIWMNSETTPGGIFWAKECSPNCANSEFPRLKITYSYPVTVTAKP